MLFDQADISTGDALQHANFAFFAIAGVWVYDFVLTFDKEMELILEARWKLPKLMYLVCRYLPFAIIGIDIFVIVRSGLSLKSCTTLSTFNAYAGVIVLFCGELLFMQRIWAMPSHKRWRWTVTSCNVLFILIPVVVTVTLHISDSIVLQSPIPKIRSCYTSKEGCVIILAYVLLIVAETEKLGLMLCYTWKLYRAHGHEIPLTRILIIHNIFYYVCGLFFSTLAIAFTFTLPAMYYDVIANLQIVLHGILAIHMHRELWDTAIHHEVRSFEDVSAVVFAARSLLEATD